MSVSFRRADMHDLNVIYDIRRDAILGIDSEHLSSAELQIWADRRSPEFFALPVSAGAILLLESDGVPIAWGSSVEEKITGIYVRSSSRHAGVGRSLMARLELEVMERGFTWVTLGSSPDAVGFYAKLGYVEVESSIDGKAVLMKKSLWKSQPIKIGWKRLSHVPAERVLSEVMDVETFTQLAQQIGQNQHQSFKLGPDLYLEIPPSTWGHGDFLAYLPARNILVRRNYVDHWYIDIGLFRHVRDALYVWTDLWLDVTVPEPPLRYRVLDSEELATALRQGEVSTENAALALESLNRLLTLLHQEAHSLGELLPEVVLAEAFFQRHQHGAGRA